ncbi:MAG: VCBS repeat-containing protein, partial [Pseudoclavibacter sp.]|nr:VCBS repeat-containing protein [Pseudoclavibacter sp.]
MSPLHRRSRSALALTALCLAGALGSVAAPPAAIASTPPATPPPPEPIVPEPGVQPRDEAARKIWLGEFGSGFGGTLARGGCDVTGDGVADIVSGNVTRSELKYDPYYAEEPPNYGWVQNVTGQVQILPGGTPGSALPAPGVLTIDGPRQTQEEGVDAAVGLSVACAGDVNGDGTGDLAFGSHTMGHVWVLYGGPRIGETDLEALSPERGYAIELPEFGAPALHIAPAGDLDGDGLADVGVVVANASLASGVPGERGAALVFAGRADGRGVRVDSPLAQPLGDGLLARILLPEGETASGFELVGDVDGDGRADAVVANYTHAEGPNLVPGRAWLLTRLAAGAEIDAGDGSATTITMPADASYRLGVGNSIAAAGDVDGDGYGDFLIGFDGGAVSNLTRGGLALVYGAAQLPPSASLLEAGGAPGALRAGVVLGEGVGDGFGYAADAAPAAGLLTRVAVGAPGADGAAGAVHHFDAAALLPGVRRIGEIEGVVTLSSAGAAARFGRSVAFAGRLLGTPTLAAGGDGVVHDGSGQEGFAHAAHVQAVAYEPSPLPAGEETTAPSPQPGA